MSEPEISQEDLERRRAKLASLPRLWAELNDPHKRPTPAVTIEAILYCVRTRGLAALKEPDNRERLSRCDRAALAEINRRIGVMLEQRQTAHEPA
jgi:hypothetical protein